MRLYRISSDVNRTDIDLSLHHRFANGCKCVRFIHRQVGQNLAVQLITTFIDLAHEHRVGYPVLVAGGIDPDNPESPEMSLLGSSVTISIPQSFFVGVLGYCPNISTGTEIPARLR